MMALTFKQYSFQFTETTVESQRRAEALRLIFAVKDIPFF